MFGGGRIATAYSRLTPPQHEEWERGSEGMGSFQSIGMWPLSSFKEAGKADRRQENWGQIV